MWGEKPLLHTGWLFLCERLLVQQAAMKSVSIRGTDNTNNRDVCNIGIGMC